MTRPGIGRPAAFLLVAWALLAAPAARAANHVRVVLDVSKSMRQNDPGRQAILATLLLRDLAGVDPTRGDSFVVLPFHPTQHWRSPNDPPPRETAPPIGASSGERDDFRRALTGLAYDADWTYFYPGIKASVDDLAGTRGGTDDSRVVVLVTDGVPEDPTREEELRRIRRELSPELEKHAIRLYVLAFGARAYDARSFFERMVVPRPGASLGEVFPDRDGKDLLTPMTRIFARAFGYDETVPRSTAGVGHLDLKGSAEPRRVAVVVLSDATNAPSLSLGAPPGASVNAPLGVVDAATGGGSYALEWVLSPAEGNHPFVTDAVRGKVAVLRPARLHLEVVPVEKGRQTRRAMAETPLRLGVLVRPRGGAGDPGPVDLSFTVHESCRSEGGTPIAGGSPPAPPVSAAGTVTTQGRLYTVEAEFPSDPERRDLYRGCIQLRAMRAGAVVGSLLGQHAHPVDVYPLLRMSPSPLESDAGVRGSGQKRGLRRRETACATFRLAVEAGELPHPSRPRYSVRVALDPSISFTGPLREASLTLDGKLLEIDGQQATTAAGGWYDGIELSGDELLDEHRACLHMGRPASGDPSAPLRLPLVWTLMETPYQDFEVIRPFTLTARIGRPPLVDQLRSMFILLLLSVILLGTLVHLRDRPTLPPDLRVAIAPAGQEPVARELTGGSPLRRWLGFVSEQPITPAGSDRALAWVRPGEHEIYRVRPARDVRIEPADPSETLLPGASHHPLPVHRDYLLVGPDGTHRFRLEFR